MSKTELLYNKILKVSIIVGIVSFILLVIDLFFAVTQQAIECDGLICSIDSNQTFFQVTIWMLGIFVIVFVVLARVLLLLLTKENKLESASAYKARMEEQEKSSDFSESTLYQEIKQDIITTSFKHKKIRKDKSEMSSKEKRTLRINFLKESLYDFWIELKTVLVLIGTAIKEFSIKVWIVVKEFTIKVATKIKKVTVKIVTKIKVFTKELIEKIGEFIQTSKEKRSVKKDENAIKKEDNAVKKEATNIEKDKDKVKKDAAKAIKEKKAAELKLAKLEKKEVAKLEKQKANELKEQNAAKEAVIKADKDEKAAIIKADKDEKAAIIKADNEKNKAAIKLEKKEAVLKAEKEKKKAVLKAQNDKKEAILKAEKEKKESILKTEKESAEKAEKERIKAAKLEKQKADELKKQKEKEAAKQKKDKLAAKEVTKVIPVVAVKKEEQKPKKTAKPLIIKKTKADIIIYIEEKTGISKNKSNKFLKFFAEVVKEELSKGKEVNIPGFGTFTTINMPAKDAVNPQTNEKIIVPSHNQARLRFDAKFKKNFEE